LFFAPLALAVAWIVLETVASAWMLAVPFVPASSPRLRAVSAVTVSFTTATPTETPTAMFPVVTASVVVSMVLV